MLISFNWLKQYVNLPDSITPEEVAEKLKLSTVEVEKIERQGKYLENIVVGKVLKCEKHPNADKLKVCEVDLGSEKATIVCGGSNVREGMLTAVAKIGAKVKWHGEGELVELKPAKIRGVESQGMICASDEIGLGELFPKKEEKEILDLNDKNYKVGSPLAEALGLSDTIFEIDNKSLSNRPDLWGHYGMAREVAALFNRNVEPYKTVEIKGGREIKLKIAVEDSKACSKFAGIVITGIKVGPSPEWMQKRLLAIGLRPINNIVDITNYVMLDLGKPMHAFDASRLSQKASFQSENTKVKSQKSIVVRLAREGEKLKLLDGQEIALAPEMVVVADEEKPEALAGIMGGAESAINNETSAVVFESAIWDAAMIRKTSTRLGIRTDASARFEKSLDPALCEESIAKAIELVQQMCPEAKVASKLVVEGKPSLFTGPLEIPAEFFAKKLGVEIPIKTIVSILERLGFGVTEKKKFLLVKIPTWRATKDISIAEDVVEEVARIYGYDNIPATLPSLPITPPEPNQLRRLEHAVAEILVRELGYAEVYNYSFVSAGQIAAIGEGTDKYIELDNPLSKEKPYLRRCLLLNLLENINHNIAERAELKLFEIGKVFIPEESGLRAKANGDELLPRQDTHFTSVYVGKKNSSPFWEARRVVESLLSIIPGITFELPKEMRLGHHPARSANLMLKNTRVGSVYELHPAGSSRFGIAERAGVVKLNLSALIELGIASEVTKTYEPISPYPEVVRDLAFVVKKEVAHATVIKALAHADPLLKKVELFDVFLGEGIGQGYKSMAYRLTYGALERTLTAEEVDKIQMKIEKILQEKCGAELRK